MAALSGSRNCVLIRLTSLASWGRWINPHTISTEVLNGHQHRGTKYQPWNKNTLLCSSRYYSTTVSSISRKCLINKNQGCLFYRKNEGLWKIAHSRSKRHYSFSLQRAREREVLFGRLSLQNLENLSTGQNDQICRPFHGSSVLKAVPGPILMVILKPLQKLFAIILGRSIRKWWKALPPNKKELFKEAVRRNKWKIALGLCGFGVVFIIFYSTHLEKTPITGRTRLLLFSNDQFAELSQIEYKMWLEEFKNKILPETDPLHKLIKGTVIHLAESNKDVPQLSEFQWTIHVVEEQSIMNAFVFPSGEVIFFSGMLNALSDIDQLCFVLGHEISHAVLGHAAEKASLVHILDFLSLILLTMIWAVCPRDSLAIIGQWIQSRFQEKLPAFLKQSRTSKCLDILPLGFSWLSAMKAYYPETEKKLLFVMPYNRTLEAEADKVGLQFAAKACMDVRASSVFWQQMELSETVLGKSKVPEWLSTHPSHQNRAKLLDRLIPEALKIREECNCPVLPSQDPRLIFKLSKQLLQDGSVTSIPGRGLEDKTKVTLPFSKKEKIPIDVAVDKGLQR